MRRPTLLEKMYGSGFRPMPDLHVTAPFHGCAVEGCRDPVYGSVELYVDDTPPALDWYTRLLAKLPTNTWTRMGFCQSHLGDVTRRSVDEFWDQPDTWAPWRAPPPVLMHPPKVIAATSEGSVTAVADDLT